MASELGGSQISSLLETLPGIANVLRSPVADALVGVIRAGAGLSEFRFDDADELIKYAVRRGLMNGDEGDRLLADLREVSEPGTGRSGRQPERPRAAEATPEPEAAIAPVPAAPTRPKPAAAKPVAAPKPAAAKPAKAAKPKPATPVKPAKAAQPARKPAKPAKSGKSAKAVKANRSAKPAKSGRAKAASRPVKTAKTAKTVKAGKKAPKGGRKR